VSRPKFEPSTPRLQATALQLGAACSFRACRNEAYRVIISSLYGLVMAWLMCLWLMWLYGPPSLFLVCGNFSGVKSPEV